MSCSCAAAAARGLGVEVDDHDVRAARDQRARGREADTPRAAGDERDLAGSARSRAMSRATAGSGATAASSACAVMSAAESWPSAAGRRHRRRGGRLRGRARARAPRDRRRCCSRPSAQLALGASGDNSGILHTGFDSHAGRARDAADPARGGAARGAAGRARASRCGAAALSSRRAPRDERAGGRVAGATTRARTASRRASVRTAR